MSVEGVVSHGIYLPSAYLVSIGDRRTLPMKKEKGVRSDRYTTTPLIAVGLADPVARALDGYPHSGLVFCIFSLFLLGVAQFS